MSVIRQIPKRSEIVEVVEISAAHRGRVGSRCETAHLQSELRRIIAIASGRAAIAAGEKNRHSLRGCLLPELIEKLISGGAEGCLADSVAFADDRGDVVIDDVLSGQIDAQSRVRCGGDNEFDCGAGGHSAGPFEVEIRLDLVRLQARIRAIHDHGRVVRRDAKQSAELLQVHKVDISLADDCDCLPGAIDRGRGVPERRYIVDGREIIRTDTIKGQVAGKIRQGEKGSSRCERAGSFRPFEGADDVVHRVSREIVEGEDARNSG